jgi:DNA-binding transcriptional LysR family regulator
VVGVVTGVTPDKWLRTWRDRMPGVPLQVLALTDDEVAGALLHRADLVLARIPVDGLDADTLHVIPLWDETPVVVAAKDHPIRAFDTLTLAEIADEELYPGWDAATLDIVAAGHGVARMPQAVLRATGRRDVVGRPLTDAEPTRVGLIWPRASGGPLVEEFVGIVRGRTANSSRGTETPPAEPEPTKKPKGPAQPPPKGRSKTPRSPRKNNGRASGRRR